MPRLSPDRNPSYRRHKASGQAIVTLNGIDCYLGDYGSKASRQNYDAAVAQWMARGRTVGPVASDISLAELAAAYWRHCEGYYRAPDGQPTSELHCVKAALGELIGLFGREPAAEFGPVKLLAVRDQMIGRGWSRKTINMHTDRVRRAFKWAASREMIPGSIPQCLATLAGLRAGRSAAIDRPPVAPVPDATVQQTLDFAPRVVQAMVKFQRATGCRPGEVCALRLADVDRTGPAWIYRPVHHKNTYRGQVRAIAIGLRAQAVLTPFINMADPEAFIFSPRASETERRAARTAARVTPTRQGNVVGSARKRRPKIGPGVSYTTASYRHAVHRACDRALPLSTG